MDSLALLPPFNGMLRVRSTAETVRGEVISYLEMTLDFDFAYSSLSYFVRLPGVTPPSDFIILLMKTCLLFDLMAGLLSDFLSV